MSKRPPKVGVNDDGAILVLDGGFAASKFSGKPWEEGIQFSADETFNGSFRDVPPDRATALANEARAALSESPKSPRPTKSNPDKTPSAQPQPEPNPQQKLAKAQADPDYWGAIAAKPTLSPEAAAWAFNIARSARAEVALRQKGLQAQAQPDDPMLSLLNLPAPTPSPPPSSDPTIPES